MGDVDLYIYWEEWRGVRCHYACKPPQPPCDGRHPESDRIFLHSQQSALCACVCKLSFKKANSFFWYSANRFWWVSLQFQSQILQKFYTKCPKCLWIIINRIIIIAFIGASLCWDRGKQFLFLWPCMRSYCSLCHIVLGQHNRLQQHRRSVAMCNNHTAGHVIFQ